MNMQTDKTSVAASTATSVDIKRILQMIPHRYPMLMVDKVTEMVLAESAIGIKNVSINEPFFQGHFPSEPVMPGVLIVEAMAQTGAVAVLSQEENRGRLALFAGIDDVRFKRIVEPGDELVFECTLEAVRGPVGKGKATAKVDGQLAARGTLTFAVER